MIFLIFTSMILCNISLIAAEIACQRPEDKHYQKAKVICDLVKEKATNKDKLQVLANNNIGINNLVQGNEALKLLLENCVDGIVQQVACAKNQELAEKNFGPYRANIKETGDSMLNALSGEKQESSIKCNKDSSSNCQNKSIDNSNHDLNQLSHLIDLKSDQGHLNLPNDNTSCTCSQSRIKDILNNININKRSLKSALKKLNRYIKDDRLKKTPIKMVERLFEELAASGSLPPQSCKNLYSDLTGKNSDQAYNDLRFYKACDGVTIDRADFYKNDNNYALRNIKSSLAQIAIFMKDLKTLSKDTESVPKGDCRDYFSFLTKSINNFTQRSSFPISKQCQENEIIKKLNNKTFNITKVKRTISKIQESYEKFPILKQFIFSDVNDLSRVLGGFEQIRDGYSSKDINERANIVRSMMTKKNSSDLADLNCKHQAQLIKKQKRKRFFLKRTESEDLSFKINPSHSISQNQILSSMRRYFQDADNIKDIDDIRLKKILYSKMAPRYCDLMKEAKDSKKSFELEHAGIEDLFLKDDKEMKNLGLNSSILIEGEKRCKGDKSPTFMSSLSDQAKSCLYFENCSKLDSNKIFKSISSISDLNELSPEEIVPLQENIEKPINDLYPNGVPKYEPAPRRVYNQSSFANEYKTQGKAKLEQKLESNNESQDNISKYLNELSKNKKSGNLTPKEVSQIESREDDLKDKLAELQEENKRLISKIDELNKTDRHVANNEFTNSPKVASSAKSRLNRQPSSSQQSKSQGRSSSNVSPSRKQEIYDNLYQEFRGNNNIPVGSLAQITIAELGVDIKTSQDLLKNIDLIEQKDAQSLEIILEQVINSEDIQINDETIKFNKDDYPSILKIIQEKLNKKKQVAPKSVNNKLLNEAQAYKHIYKNVYQDFLESSDVIMQDSTF